MEQSRDYAVTRIAQWMADRCARRYTRKQASDIFGRVRKVYEENWLDLVQEAQTDDFAKSLLATRSPIALAAHYEDNYAKSVGYLESMLAGRDENTNQFRSAVPASVFQEYFQPIIDGGKTNLNFIECVRRESSIVFPDEITDPEIDACFMFSYGGVDNYTKLTISLLRVSSALFSYLGEHKASGEVREILRRKAKVYDSLTSFTAEPLEILFGDLKP